MLEPWEAKARLHGGGEIAFLDVREAGQFGEGHPLFAVPCPYSRLELVVSALVPRLDVPVLLIDSGDGVAEKAARRLEGLGYGDVSVVAGGTPAWEQAGLTLFKGVNVPSKTLGELAEAIWHPRTIDAATLREWHGNGEAFRFFDARPPAEFSKMHVPGAVCLPNGELAHRFAAAVKDPETPVLISCAGRTRGIVGAIGLKLAGVPNPVFALENGTQGWALAGEDLVRDDLAEPYPDPGEADLGENRRRAKSICERFQIPWIEGASSLADSPGRSDPHDLSLRCAFRAGVRRWPYPWCSPCPRRTTRPGHRPVDRRAARARSAGRRYGPARGAGGVLAEATGLGGIRAAQDAGAPLPLVGRGWG
jgi:rhodanese-related sulfurtransferase